jgi:hypothetical protein
MPITKNPAAVALGRKGGKKGGPARAARLTPAQRSESARKAVQARWAKQGRTPAAAAPPDLDTSDAALLDLLGKIKESNDPVEVRDLATRIEKVIFHKQHGNA